ncbi:hypothetical protein [uncultured Legionella sp.]|uniref:hypothetical protein n=1 Tax=uncultured Legionella sp. TaxID=210934 RepID=UPI0026377CA1|nr:hypothetical protein [uncultured Legionella sp.]
MLRVTFRSNDCHTPNWDKTREHRANGALVREEYDDLEGDKPSCFSGVKRRLFQAVQGHPLMTLLTKEHLSMELRDFMRQIFQSRLTNDSCRALLKVYFKMMALEEPDEQERTVLEHFNPTQEEKQVFYNTLSKQYEAQFDEAFQRWVDQQLAVPPKEYRLNLWVTMSEQTNALALLDEYATQQGLPNREDMTQTFYRYAKQHQIKCSRQLAEDCFELIELYDTLVQCWEESNQYAIPPASQLGLFSGTRNSKEPSTTLGNGHPAPGPK